MLVSQEKAAAIRQQLQTEQKVWYHKPRYGLFSYLPDHGFGSGDTKFNTTLNFKDENGKIKTSPRNFSNARPRTAHPAIDAFTKVGYLCNGDEYIDPTKTMKYRDGGSTKNSTHTSNFRPSGGNFTQIKAPYEYISDPGQPDQAGAPRKNFITSPMKKGKGSTTSGHLFSTFTYESDPYENANMLSSLERKQHVSKNLHGAFQTTFKKRDHFTINRRVYHVPGHLRGHVRTTSNGDNVKPFLNSDKPKKGYNCTINPFPEYKEELPLQKEFYSTKSSESIWKHTYNDRTVPTPSIKTYNAIYRPRRKN